MNSTSEPCEIELWQPTDTRIDQDTLSLGDLLHDCVHAGAAVSFILPFSREAATAFWRDKVLPAVQNGTCLVVVARRGDEIIGTVQVDLATPPNQPHRGEIKKLLVHPSARRAGIARALMLAIEEHARAARRTLLTLDTASAAAEHLYASLGYVRVGLIPRFSLRANASDPPEFEDTTVMYKELSPLA